MTDQWESSGLYEHPAKHQAGTYGHVVLSTAGIYALRVGATIMSCPQAWAAAIHADETTQSSIIIRNIPLSTRRALKANAAKDGKTMQGVVLELIEAYNTSKEQH